MTKQQKQDVLTDAMIEINLIGDIAMRTNNRKLANLVDVLNNRLVYLWGDLDLDKS